MSGHIQAVLFDLDGTLVITHIDFAAMRTAVTEIVSAFGVSPEAVGAKDTLTLARRAAEIVRVRDGADAAAAVTAAADAAMVHAEMLGLEGARLVPFTKEVLDTLVRHGIGIGIVTRNCRRATDTVLGRFGIECPVVLTRDDVTRYKPDPAHLFAALERLQAPPEAAVMVGDHPMDIRAGKAAGTRTVGLLSPGRAADYFAAEEPDLVIPDLRGLLPFVLGKQWTFPSSS